MKRKFVILIVLYLALLCAPVIYGYIIAGNQQVFNGLAFNPIDGNSYLAKNAAWVSGRVEVYP